MLHTSRLVLLLVGSVPLACTLLYHTAGSIAANAAALGQASAALSGPAVLHAPAPRHLNKPQYFWGRPAAKGAPPAADTAYADTVQGRVAALLAADPGNRTPIPPDLITASGAARDPDISLAGARYQVRRIASERGLPPQQLEALIARRASAAAGGGRDPARVNVTLLNQALDGSAARAR